MFRKIEIDSYFVIKITKMTSLADFDIKEHNQDTKKSIKNLNKPLSSFNFYIKEMRTIVLQKLVLYFHSEDIKKLVHTEILENIV